jgi:WD40 repeat protein
MRSPLPSLLACFALGLGTSGLPAVDLDPGQLHDTPARTDLHGDPLPTGALARLGTVRFRPPLGATWLAFLPGDSTLLTASGQTLSAWDIATGKELRRCRCEGGSSDFALSPDGKTLAIGTYTDNPNVVAIYLCDTCTGRVLRECRGHAGWVRSLAFSADGRLLVSGSHDKTARFWDVATGKEVRRFDEPGMILAIALAPDGKTLATTGRDDNVGKEVVRLRDSATGKELRRFQAEVPVFHLAFSPDGKSLVAVEPANGGKPTSTIHLWDLTTGKLHHLPGQPRYSGSAVFTPDSKTLATSSDHGVILWDVASGKVSGRIGKPYDWTGVLSYSSDGKLLAATGDGMVRLWDSAGKESPALPEGHQGGVSAVAWSPDGKTLTSAGRDGTVRFWEAATGQPGRRHSLPAPKSSVSHLQLAADGATLAWSDGTRIAQLDVVTGKPLRSLDFPEVVYDFALSPDGKHLAAYGRNRTLRLVDRASGKVVRELSKKDSQPVSHLAFAPDSRTLAVGFEEDDGNALALLDTASGERRSLLRWPGGVVVLPFSPDGKTLAVSLAGNRLVLVNVARGEEILTLRMPGHADQLAYSPDGKLLATATSTGAIHLWELATGKELSRTEGDRGAVSCLAFSADGRRLASGHGTTLLTWDVWNLKGEPRAVADLSPRKLEGLWADLAGAEAGQAYRAMGTLVAAPEQAVRFLQQQVQPVAPPDPKQLARLIADLDADDFEVREKATRELAKLGPLTGPALKQALAGQPSVEVRQRVGRLLERLDTFAPTEDELRPGRAIAVLEMLGTAEARQVLEKLARGAAGTRPTEEAKAALQRLARRTTSSP